MTTKIIICLIAFFSFFTAIVSAQIPLSIEDPAMDAWAADPAHRPVLTGKLINYTAEDLKNNPITLELPVTTLNSHETVNVEVGSDGSFQYHFPFAIPNQRMWFNAGNLFSGEIIISSGLHIDLDLALLKKDSSNYVNPGARFSGHDGVTSGMLNEFSVFIDDAYMAFSDAKQAVIVSSISPEEKLPKLRQIYTDIFEVQNQYFRTHDKRMETILTNKRWSDFYADIVLIYTRARTEIPADLWEEVMAHQPIGINDGGQYYYQVLNWYSTITTKNILESAILKMMPERKAEMVILAGKPKSYDTIEEKEYYENGLPSLHSSIVVEMANSSLKKTEAIFAEVNKREMQATLMPAVKGELPGTPFKSYQHGADLYTSNINDIDSLFEHFRAFYPGKAIIFDIWTTWCGPCKSDMKQSNPKKEEIKKAGLPVEIIYLCYPTGSNIEKWAFIINENEFTGTHFYLNEVQAKQLKERYKIKHFPTHLTFTRKGELDVDAVNGISDIDIEALKEKI